ADRKGGSTIKPAGWFNRSFFFFLLLLECHFTFASLIHSCLYLLLHLNLFIKLQDAVKSVDLVSIEPNIAQCLLENELSFD
ncbi:hypothetical protein BC941DRAFT_509382, partial [Chlamydoabsidia padenii]